MKKVWITFIAAGLTTTAIGASADEANYAPPVATHVTDPSSAAVARKAARTADHKLSSAVRKAIVKGGDVDVSHLTVTARSGKITLAGSLPDEAQIERAKQHAQSVQGVTEVASRLALDEPGR